MSRAADRYQRQLLELQRAPGNDFCADCQAKNPRWAAWDWGIFLCLQCAGIHRKMGTHVSKVKSLTMDTWSREQIEHIRANGNIKVNLRLNPNEKTNPPPKAVDDAAREYQMEKYIRDKYEHKKFMDPGYGGAVKTAPSRPYQFSPPPDPAPSFLPPPTQRNSDIATPPALPPRPSTSSNLSLERPPLPQRAATTGPTTKSVTFCEGHVRVEYPDEDDEDYSIPVAPLPLSRLLRPPAKCILKPPRPSRGSGEWTFDLEDLNVPRRSASANPMMGPNMNAPPVMNLGIPFQHTPMALKPQATGSVPHNPFFGHIQHTLGQGLQNQLTSPFQLQPQYTGSMLQAQPTGNIFQSSSPGGILQPQSTGSMMLQSQSTGNMMFQSQSTGNMLQRHFTGSVPAGSPLGQQSIFQQQQTQPTLQQQPSDSFSSLWEGLDLLDSKGSTTRALEPPPTQARVPSPINPFTTMNSGNFESQFLQPQPTSMGNDMRARASSLSSPFLAPQATGLLSASPNPMPFSSPGNGINMQRTGSPFMAGSTLSRSLPASHSTPFSTAPVSGSVQTSASPLQSQKTGFVPSSQFGQDLLKDPKFSGSGLQNNTLSISSGISGLFASNASSGPNSNAAGMMSSSPFGTPSNSLVTANNGGSFGLTRPQSQITSGSVNPFLTMSSLGHALPNVQPQTTGIMQQQSLPNPFFQGSTQNADMTQLGGYGHMNAPQPYNPFTQR